MLSLFLFHVFWLVAILQTIVPPLVGTNIFQPTRLLKNWDGSVLETDTNVAYGSTPSYDGATPTKSGSAQYTYTFTGWSPSVTSVTDDAVYTAQFSDSVNTYSVTWKNWDGSVLETDTNVAYGSTPSYDGATPIKYGDAQYSYVFTGWSPAIVPATENAVYIAQFSSSTNTYTVTWKNWDGTTLEVDTNLKYGSRPSYDGATPTKPDDSDHSYVFSGWSPSIAIVSQNQVYSAVFEQHKKIYQFEPFEDKTIIYDGNSHSHTYLGYIPKCFDYVYNTRYVFTDPGTYVVSLTLTDTNDYYEETILSSTFKIVSEYNSFNFKMIDNKLTVIGYSGSEKEITIPSVMSVDGIDTSVDSIGANCFEGNSKIEKVEISFGIKTIGEFGFSYCQKLKTIYIPSSVTTIGRSCFYMGERPTYEKYCSTRLAILCGAQSAPIGYYIYSFSNPVYKTWNYGFNTGDSTCCYHDVTMWGVTSYGVSGDFEYAVINNSFVTILKYLGSSTDSLEMPEKIDGKSVTNIAPGAFRIDGVDVENITLPKEVTSIYGSSFKQLVLFSESKLSDTLKENYNTYDGLYPNVVENFSGTKGTYRGLKYATCLDNGDEKIVIYGGRPYTSTLTIPSEINSLPVEKITNQAFYSVYDESMRTFIEEVIFPDCLKTIGVGAFWSCYSLKNVTFGKGLKTIGEYAFTATIIEDIILPNAVESIGNGVFANGKLKGDLYIPKSVKRMGHRVFESCGDLSVFVYFVQTNKPAGWEDDWLTYEGTYIKPSVLYDCDNDNV